MRLLSALYLLYLMFVCYEEVNSLKSNPSLLFSLLPCIGAGAAMAAFVAPHIAFHAPVIRPPMLSSLLSVLSLSLYALPLASDCSHGNGNVRSIYIVCVGRKIVYIHHLVGTRVPGYWGAGVLGYQCTRVPGYFISYYFTTKSSTI